jgi:hypothetical protein
MANLSEVFTNFGKKVSFHENNLCDTLVNLTSNKNIKSLANSYGMEIQTVAWEDTARSKNSCWGPNISDMTLHTQGRNMPIFRKPNFADITTEVDIEKFNLVVGNEKGKELSKVTLKEYLENISKYTNNEKVNTMYLERDSKILTSSQACILPLENGEVEFNVRLYNYQTRKNDPAVLVIVSSSQGTSCQIIDSSDTKLYFNNNGKASNFLAKRLKDDRKERGVPLEGEMTQEEKERNALYVFQIPLKQKPLMVRKNTCYNYENSINYNINDCEIINENEEEYDNYKYIKEGCYNLNSLGMGVFGGLEDEMCFDSFGTTTRSVSNKEKKKAKNHRGFDNAVLRAGESHGPYYGTNNLELTRDDKYPIRCTVQFYKVTDDEEIPQDEIVKISDQLNKIYNLGSVISSLVYDDTNRITEPTLSNNSAPKNYLSGWSELL